MSILILTILSKTMCMLVADWPGNTGKNVRLLVCEGRFYKGYRLKEGDNGEIIFKNSPLNNLCLWKFFPTSCIMTFSCSKFNVSSGSDQATCSSKLITKVQGESARRWCGKVKPPQEKMQMIIRESFLVGYFALLTGFHQKDDQFKCKIGCFAADQVITPTENEKEDPKCKCGVTSLSRVQRSSSSASLSRALRPSLLAPIPTDQSPLFRIIGGTAAMSGSVPWQASLTISGEVFCGASVITDRHLVTAAHCTVQLGQGVVRKVDILLNLYNREDTRHAVEGKIHNFVNHPKFNAETLENDIAVISLKSRLYFGKGKVTISNLYCIFTGQHWLN